MKNVYLSGGPNPGDTTRLPFGCYRLPIDPLTGDSLRGAYEFDGSIRIIDDNPCQVFEWRGALQSYGPHLRDEDPNHESRAGSLRRREPTPNETKGEDHGHK